MVAAELTLAAREAVNEAVEREDRAAKGRPFHAAAVRGAVADVNDGADESIGRVVERAGLAEGLAQDHRSAPLSTFWQATELHAHGDELPAERFAELAAGRD